MTVLYEPICAGPEHSPVNAAMIASAQAAFPQDAVTFFAEAEHLRCVRDLLPTAAVRQVEWRTMSIPSRKSKEFRERFPQDCEVLETVFAAAGSGAVSRVVACATTAAGVAALKWKLLKSARRLRVAVVHHTGLPALLGSRSTRTLVSWGNGDRIRHIVLGKFILDRALQIAPALKNSLRSIWHPYLFDDSTATSLPLSGPVRFGFVGAGTPGKGFDTFCALARDILAPGAVPARPTANFELVGRPLMEAALNDYVACPVLENGFLGREVYDQRMRQLHYTVFPFPPGSYDMIASGAFLDTLAFLKPCIALRHPMMEVYFDRMGDIGYICNTVSEMRALIDSLLQTRPVDRYQQQCENIMRGRRILDPSSVGEELRLVFA